MQHFVLRPFFCGNGRAFRMPALEVDRFVADCLSLAETPHRVLQGSPQDDEFVTLYASF